MTKQEFLNALKNALSGIGEEEIKKSEDFYAEMIDDAVENGETEEEAVARIGSVEEAAKKIIEETPLSKIVKENVKGREWSVSTIVLIIVLSPVWLPFATAFFSVTFSLYLSIWAAAASFFVVSLGLFAGGLFCLIASPFMLFNALPVKAVMSIGTGLMFVGVSVFVFYFAVILSKLIIKLTVFVIRKIKNMFMHRGGAVK